MNGLYGGLWQQCKDRYAAGIRRPCLADSVIQQQKELGLTDHQVAFLFGVMLEGGSDTVRLVLFVGGCLVDMSEMADCGHHPDLHSGHDPPSRIPDTGQR